MSEPRVIAVRSAELGVPNLKTSQKFYEDVWGLSSVAQDGSSLYLRGTGPEHHALKLVERAEPDLLRVNFAAADKASVDALHARAKASGAQVTAAPAALGGPSGGYGFEFANKTGLRFSISSDIPKHADTEDTLDKPRKISHVVLNTTDPQSDDEFFLDLLGFRLSDKSAIMHFFRCTSDHHSVAIAYAKRNGLNHIAYEMPDVYALMRGAGRMQRNGFEMGWGIGRHGPGDNIFGYWVEPAGFVAEYTTEVQQIDEDDYQPGTPETWKAFWESIPGSMNKGANDRWGFALNQTEPFRLAMQGVLQPFNWQPPQR
jgi:catechol 2,3-dioxygenase-like lactoylglutathione lyase family enzyme